MADDAHTTSGRVRAMRITHASPAWFQAVYADMVGCLFDLMAEVQALREQVAELQARLPKTDDNSLRRAILADAGVRVTE